MKRPRLGTCYSDSNMLTNQSKLEGMAVRSLIIIHVQRFGLVYVSLVTLQLIRTQTTDQTVFCFSSLDSSPERKTSIRDLDELRALRLPLSSHCELNGNQVRVTSLSRAWCSAKTSKTSLLYSHMLRAHLWHFVPLAAKLLPRHHKASRNSYKCPHTSVMVVQKGNKLLVDAISPGVRTLPREELLRAA